MTRTGSPYLALELRDRTGTLPARAFQNADALAGRFERGDVVRVRGPGRALPRRAGARGVGHRRVDAEDVDPARFLPTAYRDLDELDGFLEHLAGEVYDRGYRALLAGCWPTTSCAPPGGARRASRAGHHAYLGGLLEHTVAVATLAHETCQLHPRLNSDLLLDRGARPRPRPHARVHLRRRDRPHRRGPPARPPGDRRADAVRARRPACSTSRASSRCCTACSATTARRRRPAAASPPPRRSPCSASTRSTPASRARSSTASATDPPAEFHAPPATISGGAAGAWWPIRSSKPAGRGSPPLGRFDSFAASWRQRGFVVVRRRPPCWCPIRRSGPDTGPFLPTAGAEAVAGEAALWR